MKARIKGPPQHWVFELHLCGAVQGHCSQQLWLCLSSCLSLHSVVLEPSSPSLCLTAWWVFFLGKPEALDPRQLDKLWTVSVCL